VAETGSILLSDADLKVNAVAYLAQHLIVLLDPAHIVPNSAVGATPRFHSGPSATADIEGVLIHGAPGRAFAGRAAAPKIGIAAARERRPRYAAPTTRAGGYNNPAPMVK